MRYSTIVVSLAVAMAALGAAMIDWRAPPDVAHSGVGLASQAAAFSTPPSRKAVRTIASEPDRGQLLRYERTAPVTRGASTWYPISLSEAHALKAAADGGMVLQTPDGRPLPLKFVRRVQHADGNWTWVGTSDGQPGTEAILTFGEKAVFGIIPDGRGTLLQITTARGRTWLVATDATRAAAAQPAFGADYVANVAPSTHQAATAASPKIQASAIQAQAADRPIAGMATVDLVLGYTTGFAQRLGGASQAVTRLNFMVDVANQAYRDSQVAGQLRLLRTVQVDYADATSNRTALFELSGQNCAGSTQGGQLPDGVGVSCSSSTVPDALKPLITARNRSGADLVSLVRTFQYPENGSCGIAWVLGWGQTAITSNDAAHGLSVVSDSSGDVYSDQGNSCRDDTLAHEIGHNMGLEHDRATAAGSSDSNSDGDLLDPDEYGRYPYGFGYVAASGSGNFYDIMAPRQSNMTEARVFSNPRISCSGFPCGDATTADAARALGQAMPVIASFGEQAANGIGALNDINGDGKADLFWSNRTMQQADWWLMNGSVFTPTGSKSVASQYKVVAVADFDGDGRSDVLWEDDTTLWLWRNAGATWDVQFIAYQPGNGWTVAGAGDVNGDGKADLIWHNRNLQQVDWWLMNGSVYTPTGSKSVPSQYRIAAIADFDGDHHADIFWTDDTTLWLWRGEPAGGFSVRFIANEPPQSWVISGAGDFNGDGKADVLWTNPDLQQADVWLMNGATWQHGGSSFIPAQYKVAGVGDLDGDHRADIVWQDGATLWVWRSEPAGGFSIHYVTQYPAGGWTIAH